MWHRCIRRLCALVLVVVFGLGPTLHSPQAAEMALKMAAAAGANMLASDCHGCDRDHELSDLACAPVCVGPVATLPAAPATFSPAMVGTAVFADTLGAGQSGPPDPFPPRLPIPV